MADKLGYHSADSRISVSNSGDCECTRVSEKVMPLS